MTRSKTVIKEKNTPTLFFVLEILTLSAYYFNGIVGAILFAIMATIALFNRRKNFTERLLEIIILSLPLSFIGILGQNMHQVFSWYNLFLAILLIYTISKKTIKLRKTVILFILFTTALSLTSLRNSANTTATIIEIVQLLLMIVPIAMFSGYKEKIEAKGLFSLYQKVCLATAITMLLQIVLFERFHIAVGTILIFAQRTTYYALFKGASILPIFMGVGVIISMQQILSKEKSYLAMLEMVIILLAMVLNTSRSAILALLLTIIYIVFFNKKVHISPIKKIIFSLVAIGLVIISINALSNSRVELDGFLDDNGRYETWKNGLAIWLSSPKNVLFGEGFNTPRWQSVKLPHNAIIQSLSQLGALYTLLVIIATSKYIKSNKHNEFLAIIIYLLLSSMLVTDFYANAFATIAFILVEITTPENRLIARTKEEKNES